MNVIEHCAGQLEPGIQQFLISSMSGDGKSLDNHVNYHEVIYDIYRCAPQILLGVIPYLTGELLVFIILIDYVLHIFFVFSVWLR